jgi:hypothetical protein
VTTLPTEAIAPAGDERLYFQRVFGWMCGGLAITGGVSALIGHSQSALNELFGGSAAPLIVCFVVELALVAGLVGLVKHMSVFEAAAVFFGYAALNGVTLSIVFAVFTTKSIFTTFLVTAAMFGGLALWGYVTKADLTKLGSFLLMGLFGLIVGGAVNIFWRNSGLYWATTIGGIVIFAGYTAFDVQKLKQYVVPGAASDQAVEKSAIVGALALYLDFVNLFLYLLRILGRRK